MFDWDDLRVFLAAARSGSLSTASIRLGIDAATELCEELLAMGVPGLHFYTLNQAPLVMALCERLGVARKV